MKPLRLILVCYLLLAIAFSIVTPLWEASDEQWHYPMVKYLADHGLALPVQMAGEQTAWRQEGSQPPLYYMMGALLTLWIDTSDMERVRWLNPHADIGIVVPDGNYNMAIHDPAVEAFPWKGTVLAIHLVRLLSVLLGAVTVAMTYLLARELFPDRQAIWIGAAAITAFNPMFLFISGAVNNDNLSTTVASVLLVLIVRLLKRTSAPTLHELVIIGVAAGAGMLAKFNIGFLLPVIAVVLGVLAYRLKDWKVFVVGGLVTGGLTILIGGWWYLRNWQLYGDPTGLNVFLDIVGRRAIPANWAQLWSERHTFLMSYWGFFGGVNLPLPDWMYTVFNAIAAVGLVGAVLPLPHPGAGAPPLSVNREGNRGAITLGKVITVVWIVVLFVGLIRWTTETWASQGRLMFAAIAPISMWTAVGLWKVGSWIPFVRAKLVFTASSWFAIAAVISLLLLNFAYIRTPMDLFPSFEDPEGRGYYGPLQSTFCEPTEVNFPERCLRVGSNDIDLEVKVGSYANFDLGIDLNGGSFKKSWSLFVHLVNATDVIIAQRDVLLGQGQVATSLQYVPVGSSTTSWRNQLAVFIPETALAPQRLDIEIGFYDSESGEKMRIDDNEATSVKVGVVTIMPRPSDLGVPNPTSVNFGDEAELVGYDVSSLLMRPGNSVTVTLYWRAKRQMTTDYRVFVQILEPNTTNVFASHDAMPAEWSKPTSTWQVGEIIEDKHTFTIPENAPPGTWQIAVGMYQLVEGTRGQEFHRLRVITPDGGEANDFVYLSRVKFDPAP
ncbi:MAG: glycosyltransferase family 39 protein [Anaerolineae bacterium]|nr:glycosyltransferase family 39 protein [Anaerolineae bacterium]